MASGVWEGGRAGAGVQKTWDQGPKSGSWDEVHKKKISEPARVESSSANFSMDQVCPPLSLKKGLTKRRPQSLIYFMPQEKGLILDKYRIHVPPKVLGNPFPTP